MKLFIAVIVSALIHVVIAAWICFSVVPQGNPSPRFCQVKIEKNEQKANTKASGKKDAYLSKVTPLASTRPIENEGPQSRLEPITMISLDAAISSAEAAIVEVVRPEVSEGFTMLSAIKVEYPTASRRRGEAGEVRVEFQIGGEGKVSAVKVASSSGFPALDQAALDAVAAAKVIKANALLTTETYSLTIVFKLK